MRQSLWTLGGLSVRDLLRRTARESWEDAVFGQGGRMAFYQFLAIFPSLLVFLAISSRVPYASHHMSNALKDLSSLVLPDQASHLFRQMISELNERAPSGVRLISVCGGALWAALNGTWAMIYGLNKAYEVEERRSWRKLAVTIVGLTFSLAITGAIAVFLIFCGTRLQAHLYPAKSALRILEWLILIVSMSLSFALLYRFAPNLRDPEWSWSTPGALCALILWIGSTVAARAYFDHLNNYARSYGHLNSVVILLLWLYVTNGSILIGGEMNSEIEKAAEERKRVSDSTEQRQDRSGA